MRRVAAGAVTVFSFDLETFLLQPGCQAPPAVCLQASVDDGTPFLIHARDPACRRTIEWALSSTTMNGHNVAFDAAAIVTTWPDLLQPVFDAYRQDRIVCTRMRERLIDLAYGKLEANGRLYDLGSVLERWQRRAARDGGTDTGLRLDKDDPWRLRYGTLYATDVPAWPKEAVDYAIADAVAQRQVYYAQERGAAMSPWGAAVLSDQFRRSRAAFMLHLTSAWGMQTDVEQVKAYHKQVLAELDHDRAIAQAAGLVDAKGVSKKAPAQARMIEVLRALGETPKLTDTGLEKQREAKKQGRETTPWDWPQYISVDEDACIAAGDEALSSYQRYGVSKTTRSRVERLYNSPIQARFEPLVETGRTSCSQGDERRGTRKGASSTAPPMPPAWGFQLQNLPKKKGLRECFVARPGHVLCSVDYDSFELKSWAQVCLWSVGRSKMAEVLNAGRDPHTEFGARLAGSPVDEAYALTKAGDKDFKNGPRFWSKCFHPLTEVLTRSGWSRLSDLLPGQEVAAAQMQDGGKVNVKWEVPTRLTTRFSEDLVHLQNEGMDLWVTPDHRMAGWRKAVSQPMQRQIGPDGRFLSGGGKQAPDTLKAVVVRPEEMDSVRYWPNAGQCAEGDWSPDELLLRWAVAAQADGSYAAQNLGIRFGFTKRRKIERMRQMVAALSDPSQVTESVNSQGVTCFYVRQSLGYAIRRFLDDDKTLPWFWLRLSPHHREIVLEEIKHWDSHSGGRLKCFLYSSVPQKNRDVLQALASISNRKARQYGQLVSVKRQNKTRSGNLSIARVTYNGPVYCLTVPSDAVIVRYNGVVSVTHQCANFGLPGGMGAERFRVTLRVQSEGKARVSLDEAKQITRNWREEWPEAQDYFDWINSLASGSEVDEETGRPKRLGDIVHFRSGRVRGRIGYTVRANSFFQGLAADAALDAGWRMAWEMYCVPSSPLYGSRIVDFVHDEYITELRADRAHDAAMRQAEIQRTVAQEWMPDLKITCEPALMRRWSKDAKTVYDGGRLIPWEDVR